MAPKDRYNSSNRPTIDPVAAAYEAGRADAHAERFGHSNIRSSSPGLIEPIISRRGSGLDDNGSRSVPRRVQFDSSRGIRRSSTLPVRFEDEFYGLEEVRIPPPPPSGYTSRSSIPRRPFRPRERRVTMESADSDDEAPPRERPAEHVDDDGEAKLGLIGEDQTDGGPSSSTMEVEEFEEDVGHLSRPNVEGAADDAESSSEDHPKNGRSKIPRRLVEKSVLFDLKYPFEEQDDHYVISKALGREEIEYILKLSEAYSWRERHRRREGIVTRGNSRSPSPYRIPSETSHDKDERKIRYEIEELERDRYRRRSRRSRSYHDEDRASFDLEQEAYTFVSSRHRKSLLSRDSTAGSLSDMSEKDSAPLSQPTSNGSQPGKYLRVLRSKYTGDGVIGGGQSAILKISEDTAPGNRRSTQSVFKWVQFEDASMNLDRFETGAENIIGLTDSQKQAISRLFSKVRRKFDRPMEGPKGSKLRQMAPNILHEPVSSNGKSKSGAVTWLCLPHFLLQQYAGSLSGLPSASHPLRTLLQSHFSFAQKERDMQQAVCRLPGAVPEHCFHIAQVWCLVLDDDFVVTCSRSPLSFMMSKALSISTESTSSDHSKSRNLGPKNVLVCSSNLLWSIPLEECQTWFSLLSHFWEYWPRKLQFSYGGKIITPKSWSKVIAQASKSTIRIFLEIKSTWKEPRGILASPSSTLHKKQPAAGSTEQENSTPTSKAVPSDIPIQKVSDLPQDDGVTEPFKPVGPSSRIANDPLSGSFHVFTWLNEVGSTALPTPSRSLSPNDQESGDGSDRSFILDEMNLRADLKEMDRFLRRETSFQELFVYNECPPNTRQKVYEMLQDEGERIAARKERMRAKEYEDKVEIFNKADELFQFFLPSQFEGRTVEKYWGAVHRLLDALAFRERDRIGNPFHPSSRYSRELDPEEILQALSSTARTIQAFRELLSEANSSERSTIEIPEELQRAWLHLLMAMVFSSKEEHLSFFQDQSMVCAQLLNRGMLNILENLSLKSLAEYAVFKPWELTSLVSFVLFSDVTGQARDISETYFEYLNHLIIGIENSPPDRGHQDKLTAFKQEIRVILKTLQQQRLILNYVERIATACSSADISVPAIQPDSYLSPQDPSFLMPERTSYKERERTRSREHTYGVSIQKASPATAFGRSQKLGSQIDPTDPSGVQGLLIQDTHALIDRKMQLFEELGIRAEELEEENTSKIDNNKDRQDTAIYAFTIVTVIFLPLSTVAGILGMNTNDVRNMAIDQWVFWATALPLTVIIITLCLIWAGELGNFWNGFSNLWRGKTGGGSGYSALTGRTDAYSRMDPRVIIERRRSRYDEDDDDSDSDDWAPRRRQSARHRSASRYSRYGRH